MLGGGDAAMSQAASLLVKERASMVNPRVARRRDRLCDGQRSGA